MSFTEEVFQILDALDADAMESICHDDFIFVDEYVHETIWYQIDEYAHGSVRIYKSKEAYQDFKEANATQREFAAGDKKYLSLWTQKSSVRDTYWSRLIIING